MSLSIGGCLWRPSNERGGRRGCSRWSSWRSRSLSNLLMEELDKISPDLNFVPFVSIFSFRCCWELSQRRQTAWCGALLPCPPPPGGTSLDGSMASFPALILTSSGMLRLLREGKDNPAFLSGRKYLLFHLLVPLVVERLGGGGTGWLG